MIASVFAGVTNRMESGYLLRDVINKVNGIHFDSTEEIHTLGHLYESMLKEMRDAAGDSGEFYTPRAVVRFMVAGDQPAARRDGPRPGLRHRRLPGRDVPAPGEAVQDGPGPAQSSRSGASSAARRSRCRTCSAQMNLLLHGLESPQITKGNSLDAEAHRDRRHATGWT